MSRLNDLGVTIIGAGTGGLCLAHGLRGAGIRVNVYERDRVRTGGLQGYRVGISPAGTRALHACLPPDLFDVFVATCARPPRHFNALTERLDDILSFSFSPDDDPLKTEKSVSRMTLRQVLLTGLEDVVHFDKTFTHYERLPNGTTRANFDDGTHADDMLLVAADGSNSRVRHQYLPHAQLVDSGIFSIGAKLPATPEALALLPPKVAQGLSMILAPCGYGMIIHVVEFKWDDRGVKPGIGSNDAELLRRWPGLLYDNTRDYINWGFWASRDKFPVRVPDGAQGVELVAIVKQMIESWHPNLRKLVELSDPATALAINIRTSVPIPQWPTTNVTLLGDAIHTMTPGRGVGANTALRDAQLLRDELVAARDGTRSLHDAVRSYETEMIHYGFEAVIESRKQMDGRDIIHKPVVGRIALEASRALFRSVNAVPPLKRRFVAKMLRDRA